MSELYEIFKGVEEKSLPTELFDKKDISVKTELHNPTAISVLEVVAEYLREYDEDISSILSNFIKFFKVNMVSYKRQSRKEFVQALQTVIEEEKKEEEDKKKRFLEV